MPRQPNFYPKNNSETEELQEKLMKAEAACVEKDKALKLTQECHLCNALHHSCTCSFARANSLSSNCGDHLLSQLDSSDAMAKAFDRLMTEATAIHGDDLVDTRTIESARKTYSDYIKLRDG